VVTIAPNAQGTLHHHPEEQWGVLLEGSAIRVQGSEEIEVKKGDFWRTPGKYVRTPCAPVRKAPACLTFSSPPRRSTEARLGLWDEARRQQKRGGIGERWR
jgi:hypothetical protein